MAKFKFTWDELKQLADSKHLCLQHIERETEYMVWIIDGGVMYYTHIDKDDTPNEDQTNFENKYKQNTNLPLEKINSGGQKVVAIEPAEGEKILFISPDYTEKTSWWYNAGSEVGETLTNSGDNRTFSFGHPFVLDGDAISDRDKLIDEGRMQSNILHRCGMRVHFFKVYVAGSEICQTGEPYEIDFRAGSITFERDMTGSAITADYHYATNSTFDIEPTAAGSQLRVYRSEVQFTDDVDGIPVAFKVIVKHPVYGDLLQATRSYVNHKDYLNESNLGYRLEQYPLEIGSPQDVFILPWDYPASIDIKSSQLTAIRIERENPEEEIQGKFATASVYAMQLKE